MDDAIRTARDVMQTNLLTISADASLVELERFLLQHQVGGAPVVDDQQLVGVVSRSDIVRQLDLDRGLADILVDYQHDGALHAPRAALREDEWITSAATDHFRGLRVRDVMIRDVITASPDASVQQVTRTMLDNGVHRVLITEDEFLVGIVTSTDLMRLVVEYTSR